MKNRPFARPALGWLLPLTVVGLVGSLWAPTAHAEATVTAASPAPDSTVDASPTQIDITFSEQIGPLNSVGLTCGDAGTVVQLGTPTRLADGVSLSVPLVSVAPAGTCTVAWTATSADGQPNGAGSFSFTITGSGTATGSTIAGQTDGSTPGTTTAPAQQDDTTETPVPDTSGGPLALFRMLSNFGVAILFGSLVVIAIAWPEGIEYIITVRFLRSAWIATMVCTFFFVAAIAGAVSGKGFGAGVVPTAWGDLFETTSGKAAFLRLAFVAATSFAVLRPERIIDPSAQFPALVPPGLAVATVAFSRETFEMIDFGAGVVHALAMALWFGGLVLLTRVVLAGPGEEDLVHAVRGFARISTPALWATVATGAIQMFRLDRGALGTSHGLMVIFKVLVVALMVLVAVAARQFITHRLSRVDVMTAPLAMRLRRALGIEAMLGVAVIGITGVLLTMAPPGLSPAPLPELDLGVVHVFRNEQLGVEASVAFSEKVGLNAVRIELITVPPTGITGLQVDFVPPEGAAVSGMTITVPITAPGAAELRKSSNFHLDVAGAWTVRVRTGDQIVASETVQVNEPTTIVTVLENSGSTPGGTSTTTTLATAATG